MHDVYAYGVIAPSTLIELDGAFPSEAGYGEITGVHPSLGGEAAGSAYVLARLGVATKLGGNRLGGDPESHRVVALLTEAGVDCTSIATDAEVPVTEVVISGDGERTVFGSYGRMLMDEAWSEPSREDIESARVVCLDPFFTESSRRAARWCSDASVPYVTVDVPPDTDIAAQAAAVIVSEEYTSRAFDASDPNVALGRYARRCGGLVILTRGSNPLLFSRNGSPPEEFEPFAVEAADTTGAGDSFRAGIVYGMLHGYDDRRCIDTASAIAAIVSKSVPGVLHSPSVDELERFISAERRPLG